MEKLTDAEVVKALEICTDKLTISCPNACPFYDECENDLCALERQALALIKRKDAEIYVLNEALDGETVKNMRLKHEVERLKEYESALKKGCALDRCINKGFVQDEAYKEFADKIYRMLCNKQNWSALKDAWLINGECSWLKQKIGNLLKELTEGSGCNGQDNEG